MLTINPILAHRLSTYPFLHLNWLDALVNLIALVPLLEKFEHEHGTIVATAMFTGRKPTYPTYLPPTPSLFIGDLNLKRVRP